MRQRNGFTLVELLVVIAIIGVLVSILLPAVNAAREAARVAACKNNTRQIGLATLQYAQQFSDALPAIWRGTSGEGPWQNFSWRATLLPFLDQANLHARIDFQGRPLDEPNRSVAGVVAVYQCPSAGGERTLERMGQEGDWTEGTAVGACDFSAVFDVRVPFREFPLAGTWYGGPDLEKLPALGPDSTTRDVTSRRQPTTLRLVKDGLSNTALVVEQAGKPQVLQAGKRLDDDLREGAWITAEYSSFFASGVNRDNRAGLYGFHAGAVVSMCDGSVHFWSADMNSQVIFALLSRDGSEIIAPTDWQ